MASTKVSITAEIPLDEVFNEAGLEDYLGEVPDRDIAVYLKERCSIEEILDLTKISLADIVSHFDEGDIIEALGGIDNVVRKIARPDLLKILKDEAL
jgi:hypothetical protein